MNEEKCFADEVGDELDFTQNYQERFYDTVDLRDFADKDADIIYEALRTKLRCIPFCEYLKRYIFQKAGLTGKYGDTEIREYQNIIVESFKENGTPPSFGETTAKLSALAKNWLTQSSVNRQVVFLLGFGLNMSAEDVTSFLVNAQKERGFNFKDPSEIIYWYCFKNGYKFPKLRQLKKAYDALEPGKPVFIGGGKTIGVRGAFQSVGDDNALMNLLSGMKTNENENSFSVTSRLWFDTLYSRCRQLVADCFNRDEEERAEAAVESYITQTKNSVRLSDEEKVAHIKHIRKNRRVWQEEDITEGDTEKFFCCGTPVDLKGNLVKLSSSRLSAHFSNKRMSRQHIFDILNRRVEIDRFDLITLNFFILSQDESVGNNKTRYIRFIDETNKILDECNMGGLYIANPYESFLLMCILTDCPLGTYAEVLEKSYEG